MFRRRLRVEAAEAADADAEVSTLTLLDSKEPVETLLKPLLDAKSLLRPY